MPYKKIYPFDGLTGSGVSPTNTSLDGWQFTELTDGARAYGGDSSGNVLLYHFDSSNNNTLNPESLPSVVIPNDNSSGLGAWILYDIICKELISDGALIANATIPILSGPIRIPGFADGVLTVDGSGNISAVPKIYGGMYIHEGAVNVDISAVGQGVYVKIDSMTEGIGNNVTAVADYALKGSQIGHYEIFWQISGDTQGNLKDYEVDIFVDDVEQPEGSARREYATPGSLGSMSGQGRINLTNVSHEIDIRMKETGSGAGTDFDIFNMNFTIERMGPT